MPAQESKNELLLEELREACEHMGYRIRFERGDFSGGACILKEERLLIVNKRFPLERKIAVIARALDEIGIDAVYLKPAVRGYIEDERSRTKP
jgi:hypothetical protein